MKKEKKNNKIIGWISLVILLIAILLLNYAKFIMKIDNPNIKEETKEKSSSNAIEKALSEIIDNFNQNEKINELKEQNINILATKNNYSIFISYEKDTTTTYEFHYNNLKLTTTIQNSEENIEKFNQVFKILISAVQKRQGNDENIDEKINNILNGTEKAQGITITTSEKTQTYSVDITKKI